MIRFAILLFFVLLLSACHEAEDSSGQPQAPLQMKTGFMDSLLIRAEKLRRTHPDSALLLADSVLSLTAAVNRPDFIARVYVVKADMHQRKAESDSAFYYLSTAYRISDSLGIDSLKASMLTSLGCYYFSRSEPDTGLQYFFRAGRLLRPEQTHDLSNNEYNVGLTYSFMEKLDTAEYYFLSGLARARSIENSELQALHLTGLAMLYAKQADFDRAIETGVQADSLFNRNGNQVKRASPLNIIAKAYTEKGDKKRALSYYKKVAEIAHKNWLLNSLPEDLRNISLTFEDMGQMDSAIIYLDSCYQTYRMGVEEEREKKTAAAEASFQVELKNRELLLMEQDRQIRESHLDRQRQFILALILLVLLAIAMAFILYRNNQLKAQANRILEMQKKAEQDERLRLEYDNELLLRENLQTRYSGLMKQVNPHFLFNSLNSLSSLIRIDTARAERFLNEMSNVYRYLLQSHERDLIRLEEELAFIRSYYHLLQTRFDKGLLLDIRVADEYLEMKLPSLTLQLLVENAVKHNIVAEEKPLFIQIRSTAGRRLEIRNNLQRKHTPVLSNKVGLSNIKAKYELLKQEPVHVHETETEFVVSIPLIPE